MIVATNSLAAAGVLGGMAGVELHVVGGMFLNRQAALMGPRAIRALSHWRFDAAFLGGEGMNAEGIYNSHQSVVEFQQAVLRRSAKIYFCLDASKLCRKTPHRVTAWSHFTGLITDAPPKLLTGQGIKLRSAQIVRA